MTATELATAVGTIQNSIVSILAAVLDKSVVRNRWVMDVNRSAWAGLLESEDDKTTDGEKLVRAVTVAFAGLQMPPASAQQLQSVALQPTFAIDFFKQYDAGNDAENSEHQLRLDTVVAVVTLWQKSDLNLRSLVKGHTQLQMPPTFDVIPLGGRLVHRASGTITVLMQGTSIS